MTLDQKIWNCQILAERAWTLSINLAMEAGKRGQLGEGYAVIAEETRTLALKLFKIVENAKYGTLGEASFDEVLDIAKMTGLLALNTVVESTWVKNHTDAGNSTSEITISICAEEIRMLTNGLTDLIEGERKNTLCIPEITNPIKSSSEQVELLQFSIAGIPLFENLRYIQEVCSAHAGMIKNGNLMLRNLSIPVINCFDQFSLTPVKSSGRTTHIIVNTDWDKPNQIYAVAVDDPDNSTLSRSRIGMNTVPKTDNVFGKYARECWDAFEDRQILFLDWNKLHK